MGTNFYWHNNICDHCGRHETIHVGKRSAGWSFGFRAWPHQLSDADHPDWGYDPESPFGYEIMSRADWRKVFTDHSGQLWDEYGKQVDDPIGWLDQLTPPDEKQIAWENAQRAWGDRLALAFGGREHRDAKGFHFGAYEFS